ncbi:hypothetical protein XIS1_890035 [Xenorhabdus innexi]|uniref:Uncharacterized protein n=1 Tax=Xenorhabdus innexi TaxID=290109 RepID=A0A1N6N1D6_9GAMM|nr:hypothetical protein XIS1_890035 [Xenorhabdus innexi]
MPMLLLSAVQMLIIMSALRMSWIIIISFKDFRVASQPQ